MRVESESFKERARPLIPLEGNITDDEKRNIEDLLARRFSVHDEQRKKCAPYERPKKAFEQQAIAAVNDLTNALLRRYGLPEYDIPEENIHLLAPDFFRTISSNDDGGAVFDPVEQAIFMKQATERLWDNVQRILHESLHFKAFTKFSFNRTNKKILKGIWSGIVQPDGSYRHLDEAIVSSLEKKLFSAVIDRVPAISDVRASEYDGTQAISIKRKLEGTQSDSLGNPLPADEITWVSSDGSRFGAFSYNEERFLLNHIIKIVARRTNRTSEEVFDEFAKAHFNGDASQVSAGINGAFGAGSYESLRDFRTSDPALMKRFLSVLE